jgi:hypothetical protein
MWRPDINPTVTLCLKKYFILGHYTGSWIINRDEKIRVTVWLVLDEFEWTFLGLKLNVEAGHQSYSDSVLKKIFHSRSLYWILDNKQRWKIRVTVWLLLDGFEWTFWA